MEKVFIKVLDKYVDFADISSLDLVSKLYEHIRINNHTIKLIDGQQPSYGPSYSLGLVELETLKGYIKTNLANGFIKPSKSPSDTLILLDQKSDSFFRFCINYWDLNNITIKNRYSLPLIKKLLDRLRRTK